VDLPGRAANHRLIALQQQQQQQQQRVTLIDADILDVQLAEADTVDLHLDYSTE